MPHSGLSIVPHTDGARIVNYHQYGHTTLLEGLLTHFQYCYRRGCLVWPRGFSAQQRIIFPIVYAALETNVLYTAPSWYRAADGNGEYTRVIGKGLFAATVVSTNTRLIRFKGSIITLDVYNERVADGKGGYAIHLNATSVLDCYDVRESCLASMTNSPRHLRTNKAGLAAQAEANCRLVVSNPAQGIVHLHTTRRVLSNTEFFWDYGADYVFPVV